MYFAGNNHAEPMPYFLCSYFLQCFVHPKTMAITATSFNAIYDNHFRLWIFMDVFQDHYQDGTNKTWDYTTSSLCNTLLVLGSYQLPNNRHI